MAVILQCVFGKAEILTQRFRGDRLHPRSHTPGRGGALHHIQRLFVVGDGGAEGVKGEKHRDHREHRAAGDKYQRMQLARVPAQRAFFFASQTVHAQIVQLFAQQRPPHCRHPAQKQQELKHDTVGFRKVPGALLAHHGLRPRNDAPQPAAQRRKPGDDRKEQIPAGARRLRRPVFPVCIVVSLSHEKLL